MRAFSLLGLVLIRAVVVTRLQLRVYTLHQPRSVWMALTRVVSRSRWVLELLIRRHVHTFLAQLTAVPLAAPMLRPPV